MNMPYDVSKYPWCIVDIHGTIVADFERREIAERCLHYFGYGMRIVQRL